MLSYKWIVLGLCTSLLCGSASLVEASRLTSENTEEQWENIFARAHELRPPFPRDGVKRRSFDKTKEKLATKKKEYGKTSSSQGTSIAPTRSPVVSVVEEEEDEQEEHEEEELTELETPVPSTSPTYTPTTQPNLSLSSSPVKPDPDQYYAPLLDFQISLSSQSSSSLDIDRLEESMETTLRLGMVILDVEEVQFSTTPAQVDSWTYTFSDGSALMKDTESLKYLQSQQIELLLDISFVESALQQEMKDPTIRVEDIQIMQQNALLPSAALISVDNDRNGGLMVAAAIVCLIIFCLAAAVCHRRYKTIKR